MTEQKAPRTRLEQVLRQRHLTLEEFRRAARGEVDGSAEALLPVLELPSSLRSDTIATSVERVRTALKRRQDRAADAVPGEGVVE